MTPNNKRPVHLHLPSIRLPAAGLVSIAHRVAGVLMVVCIPFAIYLLQLSLQGPEGYVRVQQLLETGPAKLLSLLLGWALVHHLLAGLRVLSIDLDLGVDRAASRNSAWATLVAAIVVAIGMGVLL